MSLRYHGRHRKAALISIAPALRASAGVSVVAAVGIAAPSAAQASPVAAPAAPAAVTAAAPSISAIPMTGFTGVVRLGHRGSLVQAVQRKVGVSADGVFGPITERGVKRFQARHGLSVDGVVGPRTGTKMGLRAGTSTASRTTTRVSTTSGIVSTAARYLGTPYVYGGTSTSGFDCSGFTQYVLRQHGRSLPRTAEQQRQATTRVSTPRAGDLVFFGAPAYHVGIYAGNGQIIDAGRSGGTVSKRSIWTSAVTYGRA